MIDEATHDRYCQRKEPMTREEMLAVAKQEMAARGVDADVVLFLPPRPGCHRHRLLGRFGGPLGDEVSTLSWRVDCVRFKAAEVVAAIEQGPVRADEILHALSIRNKKHVFLTEVKVGPTWSAERGDCKRLDAVSIARSWSNPCVSIYEVKVSRSDFTRDCKIEQYMEHCNRLYFACPSGLIKPEEIPAPAGLIWYKREMRGLKTVKAAAHRNVPLPTLMLYYLVISRTDPDRHPFFSSERLAIEAWLSEKVETRELSRKLKTKLADRLHDLDQLDGFRKDRQELYDFLSVLRKAGLPTYSPEALEADLKRLTEGEQKKLEEASL